MRQAIILQLLFFVLAVLPLGSQANELMISELSILSVNSAITPATYDYLRTNFESLPKTNLIVLKLNTPGGLVSTTKDIITMVGEQKRPFAVWITPEGASAASAGAIIASSAHYIFMSPGTNMGAATPVGLGEDIKESDGRSKIMNDLTALIRSLSASRNRPSAPFEKMITHAHSFSAKEAQKEGIIDGIISSPREMIGMVGSKEIVLGGTPTEIKILKDVPVEYYEPTLGQKILEVIANPGTAYFLFIIGVALIYFEFQAPGGYIAGSVGFCFLILAGIAFQVLPLNWGAFALIIAGIILLILEISIVSYGLLSIGGFAAIIMGSLFLFHGETGYISVEYSVMLSSLAGVAASIGLILWYLWKEEKKYAAVNDFFLPIGAQGAVLTKLSAHEYQVRVKGEIWKALSDEPLDVNDHVEVSQVDSSKLQIKVKKVSQA